MPTWLEDDETGEWEWLGPAREPTRTAQRAAERRVDPSISELLAHNARLFTVLERGFATTPFQELVVPVEYARNQSVMWTGDQVVESPRFETRRISRVEWDAYTAHVARERDRAGDYMTRMLGGAHATNGGVDNRQRLSYDVDSHTRHEAMQRAFAQETWRMRERAERIARQHRDREREGGE